MKKIHIDYYTGTGGSKLVAELLAEKLTNNDVSVNVNRIKRDHINGIQKLSADYYILVFSVHAWGAARVVYEWIKHLEGNHCKTAVISVSGGGDALINTASRAKVVRMLEKSNFDVIFQEMIQLPNNWVKVPDKKRTDSMFSKLPYKIDSIVESVSTEKKERKIIWWIAYLFSALGKLEKYGTRKFGRKIRVLSSCIGCGLCVQNCCSSNIKIESRETATSRIKPTFGNRCDMCLGCIYNCPQKALKPTYGAFQIDKKGYDLKYKK
jgi:ferredoxin